MSHYTHLSIEEREKSRVMLEQGMSIRAIARILMPCSNITLDFSLSSMLR